MRRTVKAWVLADRVTGETFRMNGLVAVASTKAFALRGVEEMEGAYRAVPCVVTYDDGRPAPRKRTTGKNGGRS